MKKILPLSCFVFLFSSVVGWSQTICPSSEWLESNKGWLLDRSAAYSSSFEAKYMLDGTTSCAAANCRWVSPDGSPSGYAVFDFGRKISLEGFRIYSNEQASQQPKNMNLQYAASASGPWTTVSSYKALECISCSPSGNGWEEFPAFSLTEARYWKLEIVDSYSDRFQINEVQFKGCDAPVITECVNESWLVSNTSWMLERSSAFSTNFDAQYILDGTTDCNAGNCRWVSLASTGYVVFDFGSATNLGGFRIYNNHQDSEQPKLMNFQVGAAASGPWTTVSSYIAKECISCASTGNGWEEFPAFDATQSRYWKLEILSSYTNRFQINEVSFKGCENEVTGISSGRLKTSIAFPNPTDGKLNFREEITHLKVYNSQGIVVREFSNVKEIYLDLPKGMYVLKGDTFTDRVEIR